MREIKFRGKRIDNGEWVYGHYIYVGRSGDDLGHRICSPNYWDMFKIDPATLGQYTGLHDKNGKEIYEGDIVRVMDNTFAMVKYSDDRGAYYLDCGKKIGDIGLICQYDTIKRVGNVYETPELLESEGGYD